MLVYAASMDSIDLGSSSANGSSIAVVDWAQTWLPGWAAVVGAVNLLTGETTPPPNRETGELCDQLDWAGNNGWFDASGKRDARRLLGLMEWPIAEAMGAMLAYGH